MLFKVDPDPGKEIEVDPDPDPDPRRGSKWIRIRPNVVDPDPDPKPCFKVNIAFSVRRLLASIFADFQKMSSKPILSCEPDDGSY